MAKASNFHTHSVFCHGEDSVETLCQKAFEKGFAALGISSHAPLNPGFKVKTHWHIPPEDLEGYINAVREAQKKWEGRLDVFLGLEVDYIPGVMGPADRIYRELGLDYTIASVHYLVPEKGPPFLVDHSPQVLEAGIRDSYRGDGEAMIEAYWDTVEKMVGEGGIDIIGHLDLPKKFNYGVFSADGPAYFNMVRRVRDAVAQRGFIVEMNTGAINQGINRETYPSRAIVRLLKEKDVPVIISSDAHKKEHLDGNFTLAAEILREAGYTAAARLARDGGLKWLNDRLD